MWTNHVSMKSSKYLDDVKRANSRALCMLSEGLSVINKLVERSGASANHELGLSPSLAVFSSQGGVEHLSY